MKGLIVNHRFDLKSNMDEVKESIAQEMLKYDVVIEEDRLPDAKHLMATFNKDKKEFTDKCKEFLSIIEEPIKDFKKSQKEIEALYDNGREKIKSQVDKFETIKLLYIEDTLLNFLNIECSLKNINPDNVSIKDLVMISAISGVSLTKKTKDSIFARIQLIENEILKAKVEEQKQAARDAEIAEKARIETEERMKQREINQAIEFERQKKEQVEKSKQREIEFEAEKQKTIQEALKPKAEDTKVAENGQKIFVLNARFEVPAPWNSDTELLSKKLSDTIQKNGFKSLVSVTCSN